MQSRRENQPISVLKVWVMVASTLLAACSSDTASTEFDEASPQELVATPGAPRPDDADLPDGFADLPDSFNEPMPLYTKALGDFSRPISSSNPEAQAYFDQGFQMMYAFAKEDAARSFREAWSRDPDCADCYWGEAWPGTVPERCDAFARRAARLDRDPGSTGAGGGRHPEATCAH